MVARDAHSLARALHDGISQDLVALAYRIEILADSDELSPALSRELRSASQEISSLIRTVRDQIYLLRNISLAEVEDVFLSLQRSSTTPLVLTLPDDMGLIPEKFINPIIEISSELVRNSIRHAGASRIELAITVNEDSIALRVSDDGRGGVQEREGHFGLQGIREIAYSHNAVFTTRTESGTHQCVSFPLSASS